METETDRRRGGVLQEKLKAQESVSSMMGLRDCDEGAVLSLWIHSFHSPSNINFHV